MEYVLILLWFLAMLLFARYIDVEDVVFVNGKQKKTVKIWYAILVFIPIVYMAAYRSLNFQDTGIYVMMYQRFPEKLGGFPAAFNSLTKDKAFFAMSMLIKIFISKDYRIYFFVVAAIQACCLIKLFREHSSSFLFSVFVFWISTDCVSWMFNGIRQFTAVCVCLLATSWMLEKKHIQAIVAILIASLFHQSALLMIPIYIVASGKLANYKMIGIIAVVIFVVLYTNQFTNILEGLLEDTQYTNVVDDWTISQDDGTNPIRVLVYSVPAIIMFMGRQFIEKENSPIITFSANMSIISTSIYIVSMFTSGIYVGRLPIYASIYATSILLPWEVNNMFNNASTQQLKLIMVGSCFLFYFYQMHMIWGLI